MYRLFGASTVMNGTHNGCSVVHHKHIQWILPRCQGASFTTLPRGRFFVAAVVVWVMKERSQG